MSYDTVDQYGQSTVWADGAGPNGAVIPQWDADGTLVPGTGWGPDGMSLSPIASAADAGGAQLNGGAATAGGLTQALGTQDTMAAATTPAAATTTDAGGLTQVASTVAAPVGFTPSTVQQYLTEHPWTTIDDIAGLAAKGGVSADQVDTAMAGRQYANLPSWDTHFLRDYAQVDRNAFMNRFGGNDLGVGARDVDDAMITKYGADSNKSNFDVNAGWTPTATAATKDQADQFGQYMAAQDYDNAFKYARGHGYDDNTIASYANAYDPVGRNLSKDDILNWMHGYEGAYHAPTMTTDTVTGGTGNDTTIGTVTGGAGNDIYVDKTTYDPNKYTTKVTDTGTSLTTGKIDTIPIYKNTTTTNAPVQAFNVDLNNPQSGTNWRTTVNNGLGLSGVGTFSEATKAAADGETLTTWGNKLGLNPGQIMAVYDDAVKYAQDHHQPVPFFRAHTKADEPYALYGSGPAQVWQGRTFGTGANKSTVVNPLRNYIQQIRDLNSPPPVNKASGGQINAGLQSVKNDPIIQRYMRGGQGGGQADTIPARLSNNEYVMDADVVSALGDGSPDEGARKLDAMRENIRKHKRGASPKSIPPKAKSPEQYLKGK